MEREGVTRVKMFFVITVAYLIFWGPLFLVTLLNWDWEWVDAEKSWAHDVRIIGVIYYLPFQTLKSVKQSQFDWFWVQEGEFYKGIC